MKNIKIDLLVDGLTIDPSANEELLKISNKFLNNDYVTTTGLCLHLKDLDEYVTAKISTIPTKFCLVFNQNNFFVVEKNKTLHPVEVIPHYEMNDNGENLSNFANVHFDRVRLQPIGGCSFHCAFCSENKNIYEKSPIEKLDQAFNFALKNKRVTHCLISGGTPKVEDFGYMDDVYKYFSTKYTNINFDIMLTPRGFKSFTDSSDYEAYLKFLKKIGIYGLSVNIELFNDEIRKKYCKEKFSISIENYFSFIKSAVKIFGSSRIRSMLIVGGGLDSEKDTLKCVEKLCEIGCMPVLSPFYPYGNIGKEPNSKELKKLKAKVLKICQKYNIPLGPLCKQCQHNTL